MRSKSIAPFLAGITQQGLATRAAPGVTEAHNVDFSPLRGAATRPPARFLKQLLSGAPPSFGMEFWERGDGSAYAAGVHSSGPRVWNADTGTEFFVDDAVGNFDYLAGVSGPEDYQLQPAGDYLFVLNKTVTTGVTAATTAARPSPGYGFFFVSRGNYDRDYRIRFTVGGVQYSYVCFTFAAGTPFGGGLGAVGSGSIDSIKTDDIAEDLRLQINAATGSHGLVATRVGSVVKLQGPTAMTEMTASDGEGDTAVVAMLQSVERVSQLPTTCESGFVIAVTGAGENEANDYYVEFVSTEPSSFGHGYWRESAGYGVLTSLDPATMPHALTRRLDDALGTVTGTPNQEYFRWEQVSWDPRGAGDTTTNPWPSFVGQKISGLFHWQDRLGFLSAENVLMSEVGEPFNFFRTSIRNLLDSDRIDISQSGPTVSVFHAAVAHEDALLLFSRFATFVGSFEGTLSPKTFFIREVGASESLPAVRPVAVGRSLFFAQRRGGSGAVRELVRNGDSLQFAQADATAAVPRLIPADVDRLSGSSSADVLVVRSSAEPRTLYVHRFLWSGGEKVQAAWTSYDFSADIVGFGVVGDELKIAFSRGVGGLFLASLNLSVSQEDAPQSWTAAMDHRLDESSAGVVATFDGGTNSTTITLPYPLLVGETAVVLSKDGAEFANLEQSAVGASGFVRVAGDKTLEEFWVGVEYEASLTIDRPILREPTEGGKYGTGDPTAQVLFGSTQHTNSGPYTVQVDFEDGRSFSSVAAAAVGAGSVVGEAMLLTGTHVFSVMGREDQVSITIRSSGPVPWAVEGIAWTHRVSSRARGRF